VDANAASYGALTAEAGDGGLAAGLGESAVAVVRLAGAAIVVVGSEVNAAGGWKESFAVCVAADCWGRWLALDSNAADSNAASFGALTAARSSVARESAACG